MEQFSSFPRRCASASEPHSSLPSLAGLHLTLSGRWAAKILAPLTRQSRHQKAGALSPCSGPARESESDWASGKGRLDLSVGFGLHGSFKLMYFGGFVFLSFFPAWGSESGFQSVHGCFCTLESFFKAIYRLALKSLCCSLPILLVTRNLRHAADCLMEEAIKALRSLLSREQCDLLFDTLGTMMLFGRWSLMSELPIKPTEQKKRHRPAGSLLPSPEFDTILETGGQIRLTSSSWQWRSYQDVSRSSTEEAQSKISLSPNVLHLGSNTCYRGNTTRVSESTLSSLHRSRHSEVFFSA